MMPLIMSLPPHKSLMRATSSQERRGSNCSLVQEESEDKSETFFAWPTILPKVRRLVCSICQHHCGRSARSIILSNVGFGGAERPFLISRWRWPSTCKSAVKISAEQFAAFARLMRSSINSRSRITYSWNQNGLLVLAATSSIEQMDMVESENGTPNFSAAFAARISPSAYIMPVKPVGAIATGIFTVSPIIVVSSVRLVISTSTRCWNLMGSKSRVLWCSVLSVHEPERT